MDKTSIHPDMRITWLGTSGTVKEVTASGAKILLDFPMRELNYKTEFLVGLDALETYQPPPSCTPVPIQDFVAMIPSQKIMDRPARWGKARQGQEDEPRSPGWYGWASEGQQIARRVRLGTVGPGAVRLGKARQGLKFAAGWMTLRGWRRRYE